MTEISQGLRGHDSLSKKWDLRLLSLAAHIGQWSKDPAKKCGAVIARPDHSILSVGFNGFPRGMEDRSEWLQDREEKLLRTVHAEVNALGFATGQATDCSIYTYPLGPCPACAVQLLQSGIKRFIFPAYKGGNWHQQMKKTKEILRDMMVEFKEYRL